MTTLKAKAVINPSTIHFGKYKKNSHLPFFCHAKSSSTSLIHPSIYRSTHYPKSSSTSLILIHLHPSMATPAATAVPAGAASAATHRPQPCFHTQVVHSTWVRISSFLQSKDILTASFPIAPQNYRRLRCIGIGFSMKRLLWHTGGSAWACKRH